MKRFPMLLAVSLGVALALSGCKAQQKQENVPQAEDRGAKMELKAPAGEETSAPATTQETSAPASAASEATTQTTPEANVTTAG